MFIRTESDDLRTKEYGGAFRRLYPWPGVTEPPWGGALMSVAPGQNSDAHSHDEEETFVFIAGVGLITVDHESRPVNGGDVVYLPRFSKHFVTNISPDANLEFLCIWWGAPSPAARPLTAKLETQNV